MSFYNRGYGGLVRFPGLSGYGAFGDVMEAQEAVNTAKKKVAGLETERKNQLQLIAFTQRALNECTDFKIEMIISGGLTGVACIAEQQMLMGQRKAFLGQLDLKLNTAKAELKAAQDDLVYARAQAALPPEQRDPEPSYKPAGGGDVVSPGYTPSRREGSAATKGGILSNPLMLAAIGIPVLGVIAYALTRKKSSVAGYRRRRSRR